MDIVLRPCCCVILLAKSPLASLSVLWVALQSKWQVDLSGVNRSVKSTKNTAVQRRGRREKTEEHPQQWPFGSGEKKIRRQG